jgi:predicted transcriptional regulator
MALLRWNGEEFPIRNQQLPRRDELKIMSDMLENMQEPIRVTQIIYKTNLSYGQMKKYLASLLNLELAEEMHGPYRAFCITQKGRLFVNLISSNNNKEGINNDQQTRTQFLQA